MIKPGESPVVTDTQPTSTPTCTGSHHRSWSSLPTPDCAWRRRRWMRQRRRRLVTGTPSTSIPTPQLLRSAVAAAPAVPTLLNHPAQRSLGSHARPPPHPHSPSQPRVNTTTTGYSSSSSQNYAAYSTVGAVDAMKGAEMHSAGRGSSDVASAAATTSNGNGVTVTAPRVGVSGLNLLAVLLCSLLRGAQLQESKVGVGVEFEVQLHNS